MKQNKYDEQAFFEKYSQMNRSVHGLAGAGEWESLRRMLPDMNGKRVLDLGCGFGWHCQYAIEQGAASVTGVDLSEKMLRRAKEQTDPRIAYIQASIEEAAFADRSFDLIVSSLALHYVESFGAIVEKLARWLVPGGELVFTVEHPVFTASGAQDWHYDEDGRIMHFPVDRYFSEGQRSTVFLGEQVVKVHRTLTTYLNGLLQGGFAVTGVVEPTPSEELLRTVEGMENELRRPMMLIISARKQ